MGVDQGWESSLLTASVSKSLNFKFVPSAEAIVKVFVQGRRPEPVLCVKFWLSCSMEKKEY